ncbi:Uncharacterised protein [Mycobacteroides abscessus subsp. abscessus]|nr:Uncharacterised protein [Mycobacteroides abscessus subsp. abscessus]
MTPTSSMVASTKVSIMCPRRIWKYRATSYATLRCSTSSAPCQRNRSTISGSALNFSKGWLSTQSPRTAVKCSIPAMRASFSTITR